jgi:hypothetical protein
MNQQAPAGRNCDVIQVIVSVDPCDLIVRHRGIIRKLLASPAPDGA